MIVLEFTTGCSLFSEDPGGGSGPTEEEGTSKETGMPEDEKEVKNAQNSSPTVELFDSTALFHWCRPRPYETVILVGTISIKNRTVKIIIKFFFPNICAKIYNLPQNPFELVFHIEKIITVMN